MSQVMRKGSIWWRWCLSLAMLLGLAAPASATSPDLSFWTKNLSEPPGEETGISDSNPEIVVEGSTVHAVWLTSNVGSYQVYYKRSTDNGATFSPRKLLLDWSEFFANDVTGKRIAVSGNNVYVVVSTRYRVYLFRSANNGASFVKQTIFKEAFNPSNGIESWKVMVQASGAGVTVAWQRKKNLTDPYVSKIALRSSNDYGKTFAPVVNLASSSVKDLYILRDLLRVDDNIYVLYGKFSRWQTIASGAFRVNYLYLAVSTDGGINFKKPLVNNQALDGQSNGYTPKLAAPDGKIYVTWTGLDAQTNKWCFLRSSLDNGVTWGPLIKVSRGLPDNYISLHGQETLAVSGGNVFVAFQSVYEPGYVNPGLGSIYLRRSTDGGQSFLALQELTWGGGGTSPRLQVQDSNGVKVYVFWNNPTLAYSANGGVTFKGPVRLDPMYSWDFGSINPWMTVGADGLMHWATAGSWVGGDYFDTDIFYGRRTGPAQPEAMLAGDGAPPAGKHLLTLQNSATSRYDLMQAATLGNLNFTTALTVEAWVNIGQRTGSDAFFLYHNQGAVRLGQTSEGYALGVFTNAETSYMHTVSGQEPLPLNQWVHLAMTYNAAATGNNLKLYVNGNLVGSVAATGKLQYGNRFSLLAGSFRGSLGQYTNVGLQELRFWNRALSQNELKNNMSNSLAGTEKGLKAYYPLNGSTLDKTANGNHGVLMYQETFVD